jgi:hypothetical protein
MIMPVPCRRKNNIATGKRHLFALDSGETIAVNNEPARIGDVAMGRGCLSRVD